MTRNSSTSTPAAPTAITDRMSLVLRAGKTFTRMSVAALPITAGMMSNGTKRNRAKSPKSNPPPNTTQYAVKIGTAMSATIHELCSSVSPSLAR